MKGYYQVLRILRKHLPTAFPVQVRRTPLKGDDGDCTKHKSHFVIRIRKNLNQQQSIDTLVHEWAHARAWSHLDDGMENDEFIKSSHDARWGVAYSECYRVYEQHYLGAYNCEK
jgi:hypothetical protein